MGFSRSNAYEAGIWRTAHHSTRDLCGHDLRRFAHLTCTMSRRSVSWEGGVFNIDGAQNRLQQLGTQMWTNSMQISAFNM